MPKKQFDPSTLQAFGNAAAGHDGVLSDESGAAVVKPCTQAEIEFYESVTANHPDLVPHLPTFLGQLSLSADQNAATDAVESGVIQTASGVERLHGKKLSTDLHIVLENITHGFKKPNVLDIKLGAQLWDEAAKPDKRARLDEVSRASTSGSLGYRIAGMRTFVGEKAPEVPAELKEYVQSDSNGFWVYNKMYGRKFNAEDIGEGYKAYLLPQARSKEDVDRANEVATYFLDQIKDIQKVFASKESRMYSASILFVYEGDREEYEKTKQILTDHKPSGGEDEDEDEDLPKLAAVKMIDFAHATWTPGKGPDENALQGIRNTNIGIEKFLLESEKEFFNQVS